jgi:tRNA G18 (ribose-2'-O)-methylase SpoU
VGPVVTLDDPDDPRLGDYRSLTDVALRTKYEPPHGLFIAEGALVIERAVSAGYQLRSAVMTPQWLDRTAAALATSDAPIYLGSDELLHTVTGFHVHRGALASVHRRPLPGFDQLIATSSRVVVIEDLVNHTNLGAIFRAAAALGMDGVVLSPQSTDPLYRRSVRVSMGAVFTVPYAKAPSWPAAVDAMRAKGFRMLALTPSSDAVALNDVTAGESDAIGIVLGTEGAGLSDDAAGRCDQRVRIPMMAGIDSLNVASAAAVAFWQLGRRTS